MGPVLSGVIGLVFIGFVVLMLVSAIKRLGERREIWRRFAVEHGLGYDEAAKEIVGEVDGLPLRAYTALRRRAASRNSRSATVMEIDPGWLPPDLEVRQRPPAVDVLVSFVGEHSYSSPVPEDFEEAFAVSSPNDGDLELLAGPSLRRALLAAAQSRSVEIAEGRLRVIFFNPNFGVDDERRELETSLRALGDIVRAAGTDRAGA